MKKTIVISFLIFVAGLPMAFAADNATPADLQQLQALQQLPPQAPTRQLQLGVQLGMGAPVQANLNTNPNINTITADPPPNTTQVITVPPIPAPSATPTNLPPPPPLPPPTTQNTGTSNTVTVAAPANAVVTVQPATGLPVAVTAPVNQPLAQLNGQTVINPPAVTNTPSAFSQQTSVAVQGGTQMPPLQAPFVPPGNSTGDTDTSQAAFNSMVNTALPMTPDQIHRLKQLFTATQYAQAAPPGTPPRPVATSQVVNLAPGSTPPVIRLAQGFVSSLVFIDSTGAPWPIDSYSIGDPTRFNIQWNKTDNTLMVQAMSLYNYGNLAVRLKGLVTPVMLTLIPGQKDVDYRVDLRVQGLGPNAIPLVGETLPNVTNPLLLGVLDGIPPPGSKELTVCGTDMQAWLLGNRLYVRSHYVILSPAWLATLSSADGTKAYEMQKTPMLLISFHGKAVPVKIEGF